MLLVTGAGRTGTWWLVRALRSCGIDAQHERAFNHIVHGESPWTCEVSWLAAPFTPVNAYTVHLVRHPLDVIRSRASWGSFEPAKGSGYDPTVKGRWAMSVCPRIAEGQSEIERAAIHFVEWNRMVRGAHELLRIEDVTADDVFRLARVVHGSARKPRLPQDRINASPTTRRLDWSDVSSEVRGLAEEWGYV